MSSKIPPKGSSVSSQDCVHLRDVHFTWSGARTFALNIADFRVDKNERLLLLGPSGSGKSTLLSLLAGIVTPASGSIKVLGRDTTEMSSAARDRFRAEHFGIIFQMFNLLPYGAVIDNVVLPLSFAPDRNTHASRNHSVHEEARRLLRALGLEDELIDARTSALSVGQQQRVAAARALIGAPEIIIADEPTSALDRDHQTRFLDLLFAQIEETKSSLIMVSHDSGFAPRFDRVLNLNEIVAEDKTT